MRYQIIFKSHYDKGEYISCFFKKMYANYYFFRDIGYLSKLLTALVLYISMLFENRGSRSTDLATMHVGTLFFNTNVL